VQAFPAADTLTEGVHWGATMATEDPARCERIRAGDPAELQLVVSENLPMLLRGARATGLDRDRAEDVVQATLLTFLEKADQFDGRALVRTWLFGILYKKVLEARRASLRDNRTEDIDLAMEHRFDTTGSWSHPPRPADAHLTQDEVRRRIHDCMGNLPERHRIAFVLREVEGLSTEEICKILDVTGNNLGVIFYRARNGLRECLEAKGMNGPGDAAL
jgi:RNA polymerase sigma-70 factor (ECF subfamily)